VWEANLGQGRLSRTQIVAALQALSLKLEGRGRKAELLVMGGAAIVLLYGARESTRDVDAVAIGTGGPEVFEAAKDVAGELELPEDWLNEGAKGYLHGLTIGESVFESAALTVKAVAVPQLLAMKLSAWRDDVDIGDAGLLLSKLSGARDEIWSRVRPHVVPGRELKAQLAFDDLWESQHGTS
jgi:hypothetical protein